MTARAFWLGTSPLITAQPLTRDALPAELEGALVVQPEPLGADALRRLQSDVRARGGRLAAQLGDAPPQDAELFQFSRVVCGDDELRRQLEAVLAEPGALLPREARFTFRSHGQVEAVAHAVAALLKNPPQRVVGLIELLLNACEHGNLGIRGEKQELLANGQWLDELARRERTEPWSKRRVLVEVHRTSALQTVTITDEGEGFDHARPRTGPLHGRGLAIARELSFDRVEFEGRGNRVVATVGGVRR